jgi:hypothetical protein
LYYSSFSAFEGHLNDLFSILILSKKNTNITMLILLVTIFTTNKKAAYPAAFLFVVTLVLFYESVSLLESFPLGDSSSGQPLWGHAFSPFYLVLGSSST